MDKEVFDTCMKHFNREGKKTSWSELAQRFDYISGEAIRSHFKRERAKTGLKNKRQTMIYPKIICFDIETTPMLVYSWGFWENSIPLDGVVRDKTILSWAGKILNDSNMYSDICTPEEAANSDDERVVRSLWNFLDGAQIVIGHNIKDFDLKRANTRFIYYDLPPIASFQVVDTLKVARDKFSFSSNSLKFINAQLGIKQKIENSGMALWIKCMDGDADALKEMDEYCRGDVLAVEELYYKFRPFISGHPNLGLYLDDNDYLCPNCGSSDIMSNGFYYTTANKYESVRCENCGALSRKKKSVLEKEKSKKTLRN